MKSNTILLFSILLIFSSCSGQNTAQNSRDTLKDLPGDTVSAIDTSIWYIFQDRNNNFWFGSNGEGVFRYDARMPNGQGKNIIRYTHKDGLCNDQVRGIQEDGSGNIYFNTVKGVSKFDGKVFTTLTITRDDQPNGEWKLQPGDLWFTGAQDSGVVYRYDGAILHRLEFRKTRAGEEFTAKFPRSKNPQMTFSPYDVYSIFKDKRGSLWFGTNLGVCRYDGKTFDWMNEEELGINAIAIHVRSTIEDKDGKYWFGNIMHRFKIFPAGGKKGAISFNAEKGIVDSKEHDAAYFMSGLEDSNGDLWTVTYDKGAWRYDGKNLVHYEIKDGNENVLLFSIYKDKQGGLWLGTHTAGAYKFNGRTFEKFKP